MIRRDEGMSVLEIMIAAVILFIVLTGVLGLVGTTTMMGVDAKQRNVMVNALNTYVERVQSLPFDTVALVGDGGALASEETTRVGEFTVTIRPAVADGTNAALKSLTVAITVSANGRTPVSMTTTVPIRDRSQFLTQANRTPETDPSIAFIDAYTPAEGAVVWDTSCVGATGVLKLAVEAAAVTGRTITNVALWVDDSYVVQDSSANPANWNPATETFSETTFIWNTHQTEEVIQEDGSYLPVEIIADGMRTISAYVLDDQGVSVYTVRHLLVDNHAPGIPGVPATVAESNTSATLSWLKSSDGTTDSDHYQVRMFKQPSNDTGPMNPFEHWPEVTVGTPSGTTLAYASGTSFSRYYPAVRALSPRNLASAYTTGTPIFVTRPLITGNVVATKKSTGNPKYWKLVTTLSCTTPTFPVKSSSPTIYTWYRVLPGQSPTVVGTNSTTLSDTYQLDGNPSTSAPAVQYYCIATYTPDGVDGGVTSTTKTNTVTVQAEASGTFTYAEGTW